MTAVAPAAQALVAGTSPSVTVELRLCGGRSLHFDSTMDPLALTAMIRAVDAA